MTLFLQLYLTSKILTIFLLRSVVTAKSLEKTQEQIANFGKGVKNLSTISILIDNLAHSFANCELIYLEERKYKSKRVTEVQLNFEEWSKLFAGTQQLTFDSNITYPRHNDIHRYVSNHCGLGIFFIQTFTAEREEWLTETIVPRYGPILRKDKDNFIIVTPNEKLADEILLSSRFGSRVKFKLALFYHPLGALAHIVCKTVDLYGNNGLEKLKVLKSFEPDKVIRSTEVTTETAGLFPDMTKYFNGKVFRFAIPKVAFRFEIVKRRDGRYHPKRGFYKWWLDEAMLKFNFTYDISWASFGGGTGKLLKNGTWVGATGDIFYGKADCAFIVGEIYSRHKFLGWSSSISYEWVIFVTHKPRISYSPMAIFWPFMPLVWGLFLVSLFVMSLSLTVIAHFAINVNRKVTSYSGYFKMFGYMLATFMEQDKREPMKESSVRILCGFWLLFAMVIATAYRGRLVSLIAFPVNTWVPTTFNELANSNFKVALNVVGKGSISFLLK